MSHDEEQEKMRRRREKAAAWAQGKGNSEVPEDSDKQSSITVGFQKLADPQIVQIQPEVKEEKDVGWVEWAKNVGGSGGTTGWKQTIGGLETVINAYGAHNSAAVRMAEREQELESLLDDYSMPINHKPDQNIDMSRCQMATMDKPISSDNLGFRMLLRMGWKGLGNGLGRDGRGMYDPIPLTTKEMLDLGSRVGVGKVEEENAQHQMATEKRKDLESEMQANETEERRQTREEKVIRDTLIKQEVMEIVKPFYCEICDKQYTNDGQFQEHLNSYDHHHKKRFQEFQKEAKAMKGGPTKDERQRRELRRMEKEMQARAAAHKAAASAAAAQPTPPPPPEETAQQQQPDHQPLAAAPPVKFGFAATSKPSVLAVKKAVAPSKRPAAMAFGDDD